jgi:hypothetical protein
MRLVLAVFLALLLAAPASATPRKVAQLGEFTLHAETKQGELCITLRKSRRYQGVECGPIPRSPHRALQILPDVGWNNYASAVPPSVAYYEREGPRGQKWRRRAFSAPGFESHFVIVPAPPGVKFVRFLAADGTVLGIDSGQYGYIGEDDRAPLFGTDQNGVEIHTEPKFAPTPDVADRIRTLACVDIANEQGGGGVCNEDAESEITLLGSCRGPDLVGGILAPGVASVRLTLGSGATFTLPAGALPPAFGGSRAFGGNVPPGEAVREAVALDAAGQPLGRTPVGLPPGGQPCPGSAQGFDHFSGPLEPVAPPAGAVTVALAGTVPLVAADQGETLCVALGGLGAGTCAPPPVDSVQPLLLRRGDGVAAVLSRDAARVTLRFDRGPRLTVSTTDGRAYAGRWAGKVRFLAAQVPAGRVLRSVVVRDAAGTVIGIGAPARRASVIGPLADGLQLVRNSERWRCVTATVPDAPAYCTDPDPGVPIDGPTYAYRGAVVVTCEPRRAITYGRFPDRQATPRVLLEGGRSLPTRRIALPGEDAWYAVLPDAAVTGLRSGKQRVALKLPPASAQCGYQLARAF